MTKTDEERFDRDFPLPGTDTEAGLEALRLYRNWQRLRAAVAGPAQKQRKAQLDLRAAQRAYSEATAEAAASGKELPQAKRKKMVEAIEEASARAEEPYAQEEDGIRAAAMKAQGEYARHLEEHFPGLMDEHRHDAYVQANEIREIADRLREWRDGQDAMGVRHAGLCRFVRDPGGNLKIIDRVDKAAIDAIIRMADNPPVMIPSSYGWEQYLRVRDGVEVEPLEDADETETQRRLREGLPVDAGGGVTYFPAKST